MIRIKGFSGDLLACLLLSAVCVNACACARRSSPPLSLRWDFHGWVSLAEAENT